MSDPSSDEDPSDDVRVPLFRDEIRVGPPFVLEIGGLGDCWSPPSFRAVVDEKEDRKSSDDETDLDRVLVLRS